MEFKQFFLFIIGLLAIFSPAASISVFANATKDYARDIQRKMAKRIALFYLVIILLMTWAGQIVLNILGISVESLQAVGGVLLILAGLPLCISYGSAQKEEEKIKSKSWRSVLMVPLTFPITVGGAGISYVIVIAGQDKGIFDLAALSLCVAIVTFTIWLTYYFAGPITKKLGPGGIDILSKVAGIILMALGFTIMAAGLTTLFPGLGV